MLNNVRYAVVCAGFAGVIWLLGCGTAGSGGIHEGDQLSSFSQEITSPIHEFHIKAGGTYTIDIRVKNTGTQPWFGGKAQAMTVDASYRWVDDKGNVLTSIEGNRVQLDRPVLRPGESDALKLPVLAAVQRGSYTLWISMVQEGVAWFYDKGTKPLVLQVTVD